MVPSEPRAGQDTWPPVVKLQTLLPVGDTAYRLLSLEPTYSVPSPPIAIAPYIVPPVRNDHLSTPVAPEPLPWPVFALLAWNLPQVVGEGPGCTTVIVAVAFTPDSVSVA